MYIERSDHCTFFQLELQTISLKKLSINNL
jgi:hypothetical protein